MLHLRSSTYRYCVIFFVFLLSVSCGGGGKDDPLPAEPTEQEKVTALLTGGTGLWSPPASNAITLAGVDVTEELFSGFSIRFTATQLFTTGTTPVWLREDTWQFKPGSSTIIIRGQDNKEVTIEEINESQLKLTLDWDQTTFEGGRSGSLPGQYEFIFNK